MLVNKLMIINTTRIIMTIHNHMEAATMIVTIAKTPHTIQITNQGQHGIVTAILTVMTNHMAINTAMDRSQSTRRRKDLDETGKTDTRKMQTAVTYQN